MRIRSVLQEFEAHLQPVQPGSKVRGKSEWKHYEDGTYRFKLSIVHIPLTDGTEIDLWRDGSWLMRIPVQGGKARLAMENDSGSGIPAIQAGQIVQVRHGEVILAEGRYETE